LGGYPLSVALQSSRSLGRSGKVSSFIFIPKLTNLMNSAPASRRASKNVVVGTGLLDPRMRCVAA
jgi:hypothetical protein